MVNFSHTIIKSIVYVIVKSNVNRNKLKYQGNTSKEHSKLSH